MSSEVDEIYEKLLTKYKEEKYVNPRAVLNYDIDSLTKEGKTRDEAILHLYMHPESGRLKREEKERLRQQTEILRQKEEKEREEKITELKERIARLTILFSKGEISEESYKTAVKTLEKNIENLKPQVKAQLETTREIREEPVYAEPSALWWLVPFFFGILGGIVAYVGVKEDDEEMASNLLVFGILWTVIPIIIGYLILFH